MPPRLLLQGAAAALFVLEVDHTYVTHRSPPVLTTIVHHFNTTLNSISSTHLSPSTGFDTKVPIVYSPWDKDRTEL